MGEITSQCTLKEHAMSSTSALSHNTVRGTGSVTQTITGEGAQAVRTIKTPGYEITIQKGEVIITNTATGASVRAWGDPHLHTSDGDQMKFHKDNLTIDLPDGTKVTIKPTAVNEQGVAYIDSVAVMNGSKAYVVGNLDPRNTSATPSEQHYDSVSAVRGLDRTWHDGTVLTVGNDVDDLRTTTKESRNVGWMPTGGEEDLDGLGGLSQNAYRPYDIDETNDVGRTLDDLELQRQDLKSQLQAAIRNNDQAKMVELQEQLSQNKSMMDTTIAYAQAETESDQRRLQAFLESLRSIA
jgi:hypothetical protein